MIVNAIARMYTSILEIDRLFDTSVKCIINDNQGTLKCAKSLIVKSMLLQAK
jgi:hypothetical protein